MVMEPIQDDQKCPTCGSDNPAGGVSYHWQAAPIPLQGIGGARGRTVAKVCPDPFHVEPIQDAGKRIREWQKAQFGDHGVTMMPTVKVVMEPIQNDKEGQMTNPVAFTDEETEFIIERLAKLEVQEGTVRDMTSDQLLAISIIAKLEGA
jgi:hypothetical protein